MTDQPTAHPPGYAESRVPTFADAPCARCGHKIGWVDCPTGGWWAHHDHPDDGHDAAPVVIKRLRCIDHGTPLTFSDGVAFCSTCTFEHAQEIAERGLGGYA